jgi:hypothetical protein
MPSSNPVQPTITAAGLAAIFNAQSTGVEFAISHIAFGTGQYNPNGTETALQAEKVRVPIAGGGRISPTQIQIYAIAQAAAGNPFFVGEIGFFGDGGATLLAVYSSTATPNLFLSDTVSTSVSYALGLAALPANSVTVTIDPSASAALLIMGAHVAAADPHPQYVQKVNGVAFYDATLTFNLHAQIIGDDGLVYQSVQANNIGHAPSSSPTWWVPLYNYGDTPVTGLTNANVTLSSTQAARAHITFSGALTAPINVVFPTWVKEWTVVNNTTGAFSLTCKTAAGSGVVIPQNGSPTVITGDGTNITLPAKNVAPATQPQHAVQFQQVQSRGINSSGAQSFGAPGVMPTSVAGGTVLLNGAGTYTLPLSSTVPQGTRVTIIASAATLLPNGADTLNPQDSTPVASVLFTSGDSLTVELSGTQWIGISGTITERPAFDIRYAKLAGLSTQPFDVGPASAPTHALQLQQATGRLLRTTIYTNPAGTLQSSVDGSAYAPASSTFTPLSSTAAVTVEMVGAGGGGGGAGATGASQCSFGAGGGGGGYAYKRLATGFSGVTVTVGSPGAGGVGTGAAAAGGTTSFGSLVSATGGGGGTSGAAVTPPGNPNGSGAQGAGVAADINGQGGVGQFGLGYSVSLGGEGGYSQLGSGGPFTSSGTGAGVTGNFGGGYGGGGGGAANTASNAAHTGGVGICGIIIVREYS